MSEAGFDGDFQGKLKNYLFETFSRLRINQLFNIIIGNYLKNMVLEHFVVRHFATAASFLPDLFNILLYT